MKIKKISSIIIMLVMWIGITIPASALDVTYTSMGVPNINSSFKTYMPYTAITMKSSPQYKLVNNIYGDWVYTDDNGFLRAYGERDFGINDDYYVIALGSYYGTTITTKYRITTNTGNVFYGILGDLKANCDTNSTHQYCPGNKDVVEFIVDSGCLNSTVKLYGSANVYMPLNGSIAKIEKMDFIWD